MFESIIDRVKEAVAAIDTYEAPSVADEARLQDAIDENPYLIVPFQSEDDTESDFFMTVKKCQKPPNNAQKLASYVGTKRTY